MALRAVPTDGTARRAVLLAAVALAGCSVPTAPRPVRTPRPPATPLAVAAATDEYPSPLARQSAAAVVSPVAAIAAFATAYINWNAETVTATMLALAARSVGQARSAMQLAAAQTAGDYELRRGGIANRGVVQAVAPLSGRRNQWVVVTEEQTTATATTAYRGLAPAWHVTVVTLTEPTAGRWVISAWQPES